MNENFNFDRHQIPSEIYPFMKYVYIMFQAEKN